ncbi:MAG: hypothetical protein IJP39_07635 [Bacteroidales bacterium]|nr:hypothetical protein [Bacteroidales bacterium]MBQ7709446.1 hypothetical protein [Bacteroidales bacterium]
MKKYSIVAFAAILGTCLFYSCSKEADIKPDETTPAVEDPADNPQDPAGDAVMVFSASMDDSALTKTYITTPETSGEYEGKYVPKWNSSDKINVKGVVSAAGDRNADFTTASFTLSEEVTGPFYAIAPAEVDGEGKEKNRTWDSEHTRFNVIVKGTSGAQVYRNYTDGSSDNRGTNPTYDMSHAILAAYSENTSLQFQQLTTYFKLTFNKGAGVSEGTKIKTIYVRQGEEASTPNIAGAWRVTFDAGVASIAPATPTAIIAYNCLKNGSATIDGVDFGTPVIITLPSYNFANGLIITVKDTEDHFQSFGIPAASSNLSTKKGTLITKTLTYNPQSGTINSAEDWEAFAAAVNGETNDWDLYKWVGNGTVKIGADISAPDLTAINNLKYTIDGQDHTITRTAATGALIGTISGEVKNLTLAGAIDASENPQLGALADILDAGGKITSVTNGMSITATAAANMAIGGIVRQIKGGTISDCINTGKITANIDVSAANYTLSVGGIVSGTSLTEDAVLEDCVNNAAITVTPTYANNTYYVQYGSLGGIIGAISSKDHNVKLDNCDNQKAVAWEDPHDWTSPVSSTGTAIGAPTATSIGGIVGRAAPVATGSKAPLLSTPNGTNGMDITFVDCDNSGVVRGRAVGDYGTVNATMNSISNEMKQMHRKVYMGGLAGTLVGNSAKNISISNCTSSGDITPYSYSSDIKAGTFSSNQCGISSVVGGLIGWGGFVSISGGSVSGTVGTKLRHAFCLGGVIGYAVRPFSISGITVGIKGYLVPGKKIVSDVHTNLTDANYAYFACVPVTLDGQTLNPAADITGSTISSCTVTDVIQTCSPQTFSSTGKMNSQDWASRANDSATNWVQGQGYTSLATDVTIN